VSGLILAAPASGSGKTTVTLGLLRALRDRGVAVRAGKSGPDYIDPRFHQAACGAPCVNLDAWAMTPDRLRALAGGEGMLVIEGAMGLFDAAADGRGATADLARLLGLPVVLVVDAARMAQSVAPLVAGFAAHDPAVRIGGVILNRVGSDRHAALLHGALAGIVPVLGTVRRDDALATPARHLGLVQAEERPDLESFLTGAGAIMAGALDIPALLALARTAPPRTGQGGPRTPPPAQVIAVAQDRAFAFAYPHLLADWQAQGAQIRPFSPLADDPVPAADLVILPGGYPELHVGRLSAAAQFMQSLRVAAETIPIYGECGGYMVLGQTLTDAEGRVHPMAGLLPLATSFATRRLHLGYRRVSATLGPFPGRWTAHEFHYATTTRAEGPPLFQATDALGDPLPPMGLIRGRVAGSFAHLIDRAP
jgi:cobyrinic acid a,c-diamide synthase